MLPVHNESEQLYSLDTGNHKSITTFFVVNSHCLLIFDRKIIFHLEASYYILNRLNEWKNKIIEPFQLENNLRSSPAINLTLLSPALNNVPKCHVYTSLKFLKRL